MFIIVNHGSSLKECLFFFEGGFDVLKGGSNKTHGGHLVTDAD